MTTKKELANIWGQVLYRYLHQKEIRVAMCGQVPHILAIPSSRLLTFRLRLENSDDLDKVCKLKEKIALELGARTCRVMRWYGEVLVELPLPPSLWTFIDATKMKRKDGIWLTLGMSSRQTPIYVRLDGTTIAPILVAGRTGAGKTELLKLMLWELVTQNKPEDLQIVVFDPKNKFKELKRLSHLALPILRTPEEGIQGISWLCSKLQERMGEDVDLFPRYVLFIDELIDLMEEGRDAITNEGLSQLARLGRELNVHTIFATQRPDRKYMAKLMASNVGLRIIGQVPAAIDAQMASGVGGSDAHKLEGKGDMLLVMGDKAIHRMQTAMISDEVLAQLPMSDMPPDMPNQRVNLREALGISSSSGPGPLPQPFTSSELATGLTGMGINKMTRILQMGQPRAQRLRDTCKEIVGELAESGYQVIKGEDNGLENINPTDTTGTGHNNDDA